MIRINKIKPMANRILTTCVLYNNPITIDGIIDGTKEEGGIREYQKVLACGPMVRDVKVGDLVVINPTRYQVMKHKEGSLKDGVITDNPVLSYNFPILEIANRPCLYIYDADIDFVIKEWDELDTEEEVAEIIKTATDN